MSIDDILIISLLIGQIGGVSPASLQESEQLAEEKPGQEDEEEKVKEEISNPKASAIDKAEEGIAFNLVNYYLEYLAAREAHDVAKIDAAMEKYLLSLQDWQDQMHDAKEPNRKAALIRESTLDINELEKYFDKEGIISMKIEENDDTPMKFMKSAWKGDVALILVLMVYRENLEVREWATEFADDVFNDERMYFRMMQNEKV